MAMAPASSAAPAPAPVAWLEGDVLNEYLLFLQETVSPPTTSMPVVAWLEGDVRDEFLRFLDEARAAATAGPERQEDEEHGRAAREGGGEDGGGSGFMEGDAGAMEEVSESGGGGVCMEKGEKEAEAVLELLLPHILDLPAFRARAAAPPVQQEPALGFSCYRGGWLQNRVSLLDEDDSCSSSSSSDEEMSSVEEEIQEGASLCDRDQQLASDSSFRNSHIS